MYSLCAYIRLAIIIWMTNILKPYIQISYGIRDTTFDGKIPTFYRTLPSEDSSNFGRLVLIANHRWFRIAILHSGEEERYVQVSTVTTVKFQCDSSITCMQ